MLKRAGGLSFCLIVFILYSGCKKEAENNPVYSSSNPVHSSFVDTLVDSLVGNYELSGYSCYYSPISPYRSDSTVITDTLILITKYDDSSLAIGGLQCKYCPQCGAPQYCFEVEQTGGWVAQLIFFSSNIDSVNFGIAQQYNPASGYSISLHGKKIH